jgi:capsular polysaccharide biosynthesis protein
MHQRTYAATSRLLLTSAAPQSSYQASALVDEAKAFATSPTLVASAIAGSHARRSVRQVARREIAVTALGSSALVDLTVTDRSPMVAKNLSASLSRLVVDNINKSPYSAIAPALSDLQGQIASLTAQRDQLVSRLGASTSPQQSAAITQALDGVLAQLAQLAASREQLQAQPAAETGAELVAQPTHAIAGSRHLVQLLGLGAILGLAVGALLAAILALIRPTVPGARSAALELNSSVLGSCGSLPELGRAASMLRLAAEHAGIRTVVVAGGLAEPRLASLAAELREATGGAAVGKRRTNLDGRIAIIRSVDLLEAAPDAKPATHAEIHSPTATRSASQAPASVGKADADLSPLRQPSPLAEQASAVAAAFAAVSGANGEFSSQGQTHVLGPDRAGGFGNHTRVELSDAAPECGDASIGERLPIDDRRQVEDDGDLAADASIPIVAVTEALGALQPVERPGLLVAMSSYITRRQLDEVRALLASTGWPLLGVVEAPLSGASGGRK